MNLTHPADIDSEFEFGHSRNVTAPDYDFYNGEKLATRVRGLSVFEVSGQVRV